MHSNFLFSMLRRKYACRLRTRNHGVRSKLQQPPERPAVVGFCMVAYDIVYLGYVADARYPLYELVRKALLYSIDKHRLLAALHQIAVIRRAPLRMHNNVKYAQAGVLHPDP